MALRINYRFSFGLHTATINRNTTMTDTTNIDAIQKGRLDVVVVFTTTVSPSTSNVPFVLTDCVIPDGRITRPAVAKYTLPRMFVVTITVAFGAPSVMSSSPEGASTNTNGDNTRAVADIPIATRVGNADITINPGVCVFSGFELQRSVLDTRGSTSDAFSAAICIAEHAEYGYTNTVRFGETGLIDTEVFGTTMTSG